jgi:hypothetical protein
MGNEASSHAKPVRRRRGGGSRAESKTETKAEPKAESKTSLERRTFKKVVKRRRPKGEPLVEVDFRDPGSVAAARPGLNHAIAVTSTDRTTGCQMYSEDYPAPSGTAERLYDINARLSVCHEDIRQRLNNKDLKRAKDIIEKYNGKQQLTDEEILFLKDQGHNITGGQEFARKRLVPLLRLMKSTMEEFVSKVDTTIREHEIDIDEYRQKEGRDVHTYHNIMRSKDVRKRLDALLASKTRPTSRRLEFTRAV